MTIETFNKGDLVRVSGVLESAVGADTDPTALTVKYKPPGQAIVALVYGVDPAVVKESVGNYRVDISADVAGLYWYGFFSTGTGQAAAERQFKVKQSRFD